MLPTTYVASRTDALASLIQTPDLGGFRLAALPPSRVRDVYWDTADGDLLRSGLALRVREAEGVHTATLRPLTAAAAAPGRLDPVALGPTVAAGALALPPGPLADAVEGVAGDAPLRPLVALRQYRTPRVAFDGDRPALLISLDVVVPEINGASAVSNEAEVDVTELGRPDDLRRLDPALRGYGLEPEPRSKFERALLRLPRPADAPTLLLPDERARLDALALLDDPLLRRRARVVLLHARGFRPDTIATQTGLSVARVRHWADRFRAQRMAIFDPDPPADAPVGPFDAPAEPLPKRRAEAPRTPPRSPVDALRHARPAPAPPGDLDALLSDFAPGQTSTPHLDDEPEDADDAAHGGGLAPATSEPDDAPADDAPTDDAPVPEPMPPHPPAAPDADDPSPSADQTSADAEPLPEPEPEPTADAEPDAEAEPSGDAHPDETPPADSEADREPPSGRTFEAPPLAAPADAAPAPRRRGLSGEIPLVEAARRTLLGQVAAFEAAAEALAHADTPAAARRVLRAAQGLRIAAETFRAVLPSEAATRLVAALRPLAAALNARLDLDRAAEAAGDTPAGTTLRTAADRAGLVVRTRLYGGRQRAWGDRARRVLDRLAAQAEAGLLVGDDAPPPPDDLVGAAGDVPVPSRLRHVLASALWARFEALRAFEDDATRETAPETAAHFAVAVRALRFVLALAAGAAAEPVAPLAAHLAAAETRLLAYRDARRTAALVAARGGTPPAAEIDDETVARTFAEVTGPEVRLALARIAASV